MTLTEEQTCVVDASPEAKILVTAGPGTGKTHVLIHRISRLIHENAIAPAEILVLSFSRAAVKEIRERLSRFGGSSTYVSASTFDSFATRILALAEPSSSWQSENYEARIRHATRLITCNDEAKIEVSSYRHVIVDEIQDLVGDRAELVRTLLHAMSNGFSLFGDPAQGIYNYQLEGEARKVGSRALYDWIRARFAGELLERNLTRNFRVQSEQARIALWAGSELNSPNPSYGDINYRLQTDVLRLPSAGDLRLAVAMIRAGGGRTAILCRDNAQALSISGYLFDQGVRHRLQGRATDRRVPSWIASVMRDLEGNLIGKRQFLELMEGRIAEDIPAPIEVWQQLKRIERLRYPNHLDLDKVSERVHAGDVPDDICQSEPANIVASSIHRAKGLEFDRVFLVDGYRRSDDLIELAEETRVLYVALTRAQSEIWHMTAPDTLYLWLAEQLDRRWIRGGPKKWMRTGIEVRGEDVDRDEPAGAVIISGINPAAIQDYIRSDVKIGDQVLLKRVETFTSGEPRTFYVIEHHGTPVGVTSSSFGAALFSVLKINRGWEVRWPTQIEGLHVECVDTVAGLPSTSRRAGLGGCGVWLRVRVYGLGRFVFPN
jgi:hypothetical protein